MIPDPVKMTIKTNMYTNWNNLFLLSDQRTDYQMKVDDGVIYHYQTLTKWTILLV